MSGSEKVGLRNELLYLEIDFLSACYGCRLFSPQKFLSFALLKHNPDIYLDEFKAWLEYQAEPYGKGDEKVMKARKRLAVRFL